MVERLGCTSVLLLGGLVGCLGADPAPRLEVSPTEGEAPLLVTLDASETEAPRGVELVYRFDFDGDGEFDSEFQEEPVLERAYESAGTFRPRVQVMTAEGVQVEASATVDVVVTRAPVDIDADVNRDGVINAEDKDLEQEWTGERGAVYWSNLDDDNGDGVRDAADGQLDGPGDLEDLAPLLLHRQEDLGDDETLVLKVVPEAALRRVRIFIKEGEQVRQLLAPAQGQVAVDRAVLPDSVRLVDTELFLEGLNGRAFGFDGFAEVVVERRRGEEVVAEDRVMLRGAPILFPDNTQRAQELFVMSVADPRNAPNAPFYQALLSLLPDEISLFTADEFRYGGDRWLQDTMQTGYQMIPGPDGTHRVMHTDLQAERISGYGLEFLLPTEVLGTDAGFTYPGGGPSSLNYGGNLEVAPPHIVDDRLYHYGRIMVGGGNAGTLLGRPHADFMTAQQKNHLAAQEVQAPLMEFSTEWLAVGHLDEIFLFVPDYNRGGAKPWRVVVASPDLARSALESLEERGEGNLLVFAGRRPQTTVQRILDDEALMFFNDAAQARIDSIRDQLSEQMGLTEDDFVEVPVLYERLGFGGLDLAAAYNPGIQNLVVANETLFIPDPEGPVSQGEDVFQRLTRDALEAMGNTVVFVDVFESYHELLGEAHCGTNFRREPFEQNWWEVE